MNSKSLSFVTRLALKGVGFYQRFISVPLHRVVPGSGCRFHPTCSCYAATSLQRFGFFKGAWLGLKRIGRCHPWGGSGVDEVPEA